MNDRLHRLHCTGPSLQTTNRYIEWSDDPLREAYTQDGQRIAAALDASPRERPARSESDRFEGDDPTRRRSVNVPLIES